MGTKKKIQSSLLLFSLVWLMSGSRMQGVGVAVRPGVLDSILQEVVVPEGLWRSLPG